MGGRGGGGSPSMSDLGMYEFVGNYFSNVLYVVIYIVNILGQSL